MLRSLVFALAATALILGCSPDPTSMTRPGGKLEITLKRVAYTDPQQGVLHTDQNTGFLGQSGSQIEGLRLPPNIKRTTGFSLTLGFTASLGHDEPLPYQGSYFGVMASTDGKGSSDRLWIDWDKDGNLSPGEEATLLTPRNAEVRIFRANGLPKAIAKSGLLVAIEGQFVRGYPDSRYEGEANFDGKLYSLAVIDTNLDNRITVSSGWLGSGDTLLVDYNRDGAFEAGGDKPMAKAGVENQSLVSSVLMPDGRYYVPSPSTDMTRLTLTPDPTPTGDVKLTPDFNGMCDLRQGNNYLAVPVVKGVLRLHTGIYDVASLPYYRTDSHGGNWLLDVRALPQLRSINVSPDNEVQLKSGPPFQILANSRMEGSQCGLEAWIVDRGSSYVTVDGGPDGRMPDGPEYTLTDPRGRVVSQGRMKFWLYCYAAGWNPAGHPKGKYKLDVTYDLPLFGALHGSCDVVVS